MHLALIGHNLPHADGMIREAAFSDLFFNYQHDNYDAAKRADDQRGADKPEDGYDDEGFALAIKAGLKKDAEEFIATLALCTGYTLDADELVADYLARE